MRWCVSRARAPWLVGQRWLVAAGGDSYTSVFGAVRVARTGESQRGVSHLFPRDAQLYLPARGFSHHVQKRFGIPS